MNQCKTKTTVRSRSRKGRRVGGKELEMGVRGGGGYEAYLGQERPVDSLLPSPRPSPLVVSV